MKKYAYSQSLDNVSPDFMFEENILLDLDSSKRELIANKIYKVCSKGKIEFQDQDGLRMYKLKDDYVLILPTKEKDISGRSTSLVFLFEVSKKDINNKDIFLYEIKKYIKEILLKTGKTTYEDKISKSLELLESLLEKETYIRNEKTVLAIIGGAVLLIIILLLRR